MDFLSTCKGSLLENFFPKGWDLARMDACCDKGVTREDFWHKDFNPIECQDLGEFDTLMGHEIALQIKNARENGEKLAMILPVGPMGMYRWASFFLNEWDINCDHVYTFNMDEWADSEGNTLPNTNPASFEYCMREAFFDKLGELKVGVIQNDFGKLNIDGDIIRRGGIEMMEIGRGSIFCSCLRKDFAKAMAENQIFHIPIQSLPIHKLQSD